jgi:hypothetical protein
MAAAAGGNWLYFSSPVNDDGQPTHSLGVEALHGRLSRAESFSARASYVL